MQCQQRWICEQQQLQQQQRARAGLDGAIMLRVKLRSSANEQRLNSTPEYIIIHLIKVYSELHSLCGEEIERPLKSFALQLSNNIL